MRRWGFLSAPVLKPAFALKESVMWFPTVGHEEGIWNKTDYALATPHTHQTLLQESSVFTHFVEGLAGILCLECCPESEDERLLRDSSYPQAGLLQAGSLTLTPVRPRASSHRELKMAWAQGRPQEKPPSFVQENCLHPSSKVFQQRIPDDKILRHSLQTANRYNRQQNQICKEFRGWEWSNVDSTKTPRKWARTKRLFLKKAVCGCVSSSEKNQIDLLEVKSSIIATKNPIGVP